MLPMNEMKDPKKYDEEMKEAAKTTFATHQITSKYFGSGHWILQRLGAKGKDFTRIFLAEIVVLNDGLYVGGDIDFAVYKYHSSQTIDEPVYWIAKSNIDYACEKADIGMGNGFSKIWLPEVARFDMARIINELRRDLEKGDIHEKTGKDIIDVLVEAQEQDFEAQDDMLGFFQGTLPWEERERLDGVGEVIAPRIYYTHAALQRLCYLLENEKH